jgi:hypothetical protein
MYYNVQRVYNAAASKMKAVKITELRATDDWERHLV